MKPNDLNGRSARLGAVAELFDQGGAVAVHARAARHSENGRLFHRVLLFQVAAAATGSTRYNH